MKKEKKVKVKIFLVWFVLAVGFGNPAFSQELTGTVRGNITDQDGLAVSGAEIVAVGPVNMKVVSDSNGAYVFVLVPGEYQIVIVKDGFTALQKTLAVHAGATNIINATLEVAGVTQVITVSVEGKVPEIDTGSSTISTTITADDQSKLPLGVGFVGAVTTAPGVRVEPVGGGIMSDGSSRAENNFFINGVNISDVQTGSMRVMNNIPHEFTEETTVGRSNDARFGSSLGSSVNGVLKRGRSVVHGQVWTYATHNVLNAPPRPFLRFSPFDDEVVEYFQTKEDQYKTVIPGYAVGGPLWKKQLFFFSGSRPSFSETERSVKFLKNNLTSNFVSNSRQDSTTNKVDADLFYRGRPLQLSMAHLYNPWRVRGYLPGQDGTDSPDTKWRERGFRAPSTIVLWKATYFPSDRLILSAFGGWNYTNFTDTYGLSKGPSVSYLTSSIGLNGVPRQFQAASGDFTPDNLQTQKDIFRRSNLYLDASYLAHGGKHGAHFLSAGYQRDQIENDVLASTWPDGRFMIVWNRAWQGLSGNLQFGKYGYYMEDQMETSGLVKSRSHALYIQDNWQMRKNLTWNLGVRLEGEYVPSFLRDEKHGSRAISFGFKDKIAPRIGVAYDPTGTGRGKVSASFSVVYDVIKGNLSRGAFGGDKWLRCIYPLDDPNMANLKRGSQDLFECFNYRVASNDMIDPGLKPMEQRMITVGYERYFGSNLILSVYGINKSLVRAIEDVGRLVVNNETVEEEYMITNPGEGRSIDASWFPSGLPSPITPRARREYSALEVRLDKRAGSYFTSASYTLSRLWGNYSGLASSDERGRINPNTNRDFDMPFMPWNKYAHEVYGKLATDRPQVFKFFGYKFFSLLGPGAHQVGTSFIWQSGTPLSTQVPLITSAAAFAYGRGDLGRTPAFSETSATYAYEFKLREFKESQKIRLEWTVGNVFNQKTALDQVTGLVHPHDGSISFISTAAIFRGYDPISLMEKQDLRKNPAYGMPSAFQGPRSMHLAVRFLF